MLDSRADEWDITYSYRETYEKSILKHGAFALWPLKEKSFIFAERLGCFSCFFLFELFPYDILFC